MSVGGEKGESLDGHVTKASLNKTSASFQCAADPSPAKAAWGSPMNLVKAPPSSTKPPPAVLNLWVVAPFLGKPVSKNTYITTGNSSKITVTYGVTTTCCIKRLRH